MISHETGIYFAAMAPSSPERYVLILAGGSGTRFWPLSRNATPKQLLQLFDDETLLEKTIRRLEGLVPLDHILILTSALQEPAVRRVASMLPAENILAEPEKRDTAPAVALGIGWIARRDPNAVMAVLPSDQLIQDEAAFRETLGAAMEIAVASGQIVTIGIKPTWPCPGYGYIERGAAVPEDATASGVTPHRIVEFKEKPSLEVAQQYLATGNYAWNAGMFIWHIPAVRKELEAHCPALATFVTSISSAPEMGTALASEFGTLEKTSIDYALMEKTSRACNIQADFDWDDVGGWLSVAGYLPTDEQGNRSRIPSSRFESTGNVIFSTTDQHIALLGVKDLIVVQTGDALLIAHKDSADDIKKLVAQVPVSLH
jgi:mannose-1-phosphate guanylyltransferase